MNDKDKDLLERRFGTTGKRPETLIEAAERLRCTRLEVRRRENEALRQERKK